MSADKTMVVLDISSDDDVWEGRSGLAEGGDDDGDGDWLSELLGEVDRGKEDSDRGNDSDEVVVVKEVLANPRLRVCSKALVKCDGNDREDDDDDDCVVLEGDPDKPASIQNERNDDSEEDIVVVGETGQVACRDYPHARHLCVKYPFDSTPHESHCDQCHCYVCDSLAPCIHWSIAISSTDHCHATEKDEFWKTQRKNVKKGYLPQTPFSNVQSTPYQIPSSLPFDHGQKYHIPNTTPCAMTQQIPQLVVQNTLNNVSRTHIGVSAGSHVISRTPFRRTRISSVPPSNPTHGQFYNTSRGHRIQVTRPSLPTDGVQARWRSTGAEVPGSFQDSSRVNSGGGATNLPTISAQQTNLVNRTGNFVPQVCRRGVPRNKYVLQPRVPAYVPQPQVSAHVLQPQAPAYVPQPQAYVPQPQAYVPQTQVQAFVPQPQVSTYVPQPQVPAYAPQHQTPSYVPLHQVPEGISGVAPLNPVQQLCNIGGLYVSSGPGMNNSSAYQPQPPINVSVQREELDSPKDGNVTSPLSSNGQSSTAPGDLNQSTTGFEINLDYDYSSGHSNQTLPVGQVQKAVHIDELDPPPPDGPELLTYTSPSPPAYQFDPWAFENEPGLDYFGNPAMDVVIDTNLFDF